MFSLLTNEISKRKCRLWAILLSYCHWNSYPINSNYTMLDLAFRAQRRNERGTILTFTSQCSIKGFWNCNFEANCFLFLCSDGLEVAVVYFRYGYMPDNYTEEVRHEDSWGQQRQAVNTLWRWYHPADTEQRLAFIWGCLKLFSC